MAFKFRQITSSKYMGPAGLSLRKSSDGSFSIFKNNSITNWGTSFQTVRSAEIFLSQHDYISASTNNIAFNQNDIEFIEDMYAQDVIKESPQGKLFDRYSISKNFSIAADKKKDSSPIGFHLVINLFKNNRLIKQFNNMHDLLPVLDKIVGDSIFASVTYRGLELRNILAAKNNGYNKPQERRRTAREIVRDLVRVKSSNVWAYGIEIKDRKDKMGDVYVQFKGKNGGPDAIYVYYSVDLLTWRKVLSAPSKGHAIWQYLRNNFKYSKLTGDRRGKLPNAVNR